MSDDVTLTVNEDVIKTFGETDEAFQIIKVLNTAREHGYGNLISWLKTEWKAKLMREHGLSDQTAEMATEVSPREIEKLHNV